MVTMNAGGGGPVGAPMVNNVANTTRQQQSQEDQQRLNTYIYDYLCRNGHFDLARSFIQKCPIRSKPRNGDEDMDIDSKDFDSKRPEDLPYPDVPAHRSEQAFLYDWWCQFWDIYGAAKNKNHPKGTTAESYLNHNMAQTKMRQQMQQQMLQRTDQNMIMRQQFANNSMTMQPNGINMAKQAVINNRNNAPNLQMQQKLMAQQTQMQRDGSMGDNRGQSPNSIEAMGSPSKRPRTDGGNFNGQPGPAGRGQPMPNQQMGNNPNGGMLLQNGLPNDMNQQQMNAFSAQAANGQSEAMKAMQANGGPQNMENIDFMTSQRLNGSNNGGSHGSHALQDYQMQLMLLEQQNKKRLLMARQEQENINSVPGSGAGGGNGGNMTQGAFAAPAMSPSGSRAGPSPNPNDQMKRVVGTPKMGQGVIPGGSPMPEMQNRGSPAPGFDAPIPQGAVRPGQQFFNGMGGNPAMMAQQAPSSHPGFNNMQQMSNMNPQAMEQMRMNGQGRFPNGQAFPNQPPQMMQGGQPQQVGTPQQRNTTMPPPPAPAQDQRTQPSSPAQQPAPPTPSQAPKNAPKGKKEGGAAKKKAPAKKNAAAATPAADASEPPPTPTPSTPITPMNQASFNNNKNGPHAQPNQVPPPQQQPMDVTGTPFGDNLDGGFGNLDFAVDGPDVLENFDFDSFLHNTEDTSFGNFDLMNFDNVNGVEAGAE
ncbi:hypothetical protein EJ08DRAFT_661108 [Tothia fuscella]|uniref:LisH domain-containing protein n=1 Tax=Tothia fuscella TaxID=1048955 RepID=A0A9P4NRI7_9PEZI|nr:hypothetical protein EJ08DRAFT_661108 [Tothia fuscella]